MTISQKSQSSVTPSAKKKWDQALLHAQTRCIPTCYQVECLGKTPIDAAKFVLLQERKRLKK